MSWEINYLVVFEKTVKVMGQSKTSHNLPWINGIMRIIYSFFKSELALLVICSHSKWFIDDPPGKKYFSCSLPSSLKKLILHDWERDSNHLDWCSITWQNRPQSWWEKVQCNRFCFVRGLGHEKKHYVRC